jgi:hypothetical protein
MNVLPVLTSIAGARDDVAVGAEVSINSDIRIELFRQLAPAVSGALTRSVPGYVAVSRAQRIPLPDQPFPAGLICGRSRTASRCRASNGSLALFPVSVANTFPVDRQAADSAIRSYFPPAE